MAFVRTVSGKIAWYGITGPDPFDENDWTIFREDNPGNIDLRTDATGSLIFDPINNLAGFTAYYNSALGALGHKFTQMVARIRDATHPGIASGGDPAYHRNQGHGFNPTGVGGIFTSLYDHESFPPDNAALSLGNGSAGIGFTAIGPAKSYLNYYRTSFAFTPDRIEGYDFDSDIELVADPADPATDPLGYICINGSDLTHIDFTELFVCSHKIVTFEGLEPGQFGAVRNSAGVVLAQEQEVGGIAEVDLLKINLNETHDVAVLDTDGSTVLFQAAGLDNVVYGGDVYSITGDAPDKPTISVDGQHPTSADLSSSAFSDPDAGDTHQASQWQVDLTTGDFSAPVEDSGTDMVNLLSYTAEGLNEITDYKARVRHQDNNGEWSEWSNPETFTTTESVPRRARRVLIPRVDDGRLGRMPPPRLDNLQDAERQLQDMASRMNRLIDDFNDRQ